MSSSYFFNEKNIVGTHLKLFAESQCVFVEIQEKHLPDFSFYL